MTVGRKPKPKALHLLNGETRASRVNYAEPTPRDALPECPECASDEVRAIWKDTIRELEAMEIAKAADRDSLYAFCVAVAVHREASVHIATNGILGVGQKGNTVRNPALTVLGQAAHQLRSFAAEFGLTPSARARIESGAKADDGENPFAGTG